MYPGLAHQPLKQNIGLTIYDCNGIYIVYNQANGMIKSVVFWALVIANTFALVGVKPVIFWTFVITEPFTFRVKTNNMEPFSSKTVGG